MYVVYMYASSNYAILSTGLFKTNSSFLNQVQNNLNQISLLAHARQRKENRRKE